MSGFDTWDPLSAQGSTPASPPENEDCSGNTVSLHGTVGTVVCVYTLFFTVYPFWIRSVFS